MTPEISRTLVGNLEKLMSFVASGHDITTELAEWCEETKNPDLLALQKFLGEFFDSAQTLQGRRMLAKSYADRYYLNCRAKQLGFNAAASIISQFPEGDRQDLRRQFFCPRFGIELHFLKSYVAGTFQAAEPDYEERIRAKLEAQGKGG